VNRDTMFVVITAWDTEKHEYYIESGELDVDYITELLSET